jgi:hypothetical protein
MNDIASMRKMRPLEPAGSAGRAGVVAGLGAMSGLASFFFGGKREFYRKRREKIPTQAALEGTPDFCKGNSRT